MERFTPATIARKVLEITETMADMEDVRSEAKALIKLSESIIEFDETSSFTFAEKIWGSYLRTAEAWGNEIFDACPEIEKAYEDMRRKEYEEAIENM